MLEISLFFYRRKRKVDKVTDRKRMMDDYDYCLIDSNWVYMFGHTTMADTRCKVADFVHLQIDWMKKVCTDHMIETTVTLLVCMEIDRMLVDTLNLIDHMVTADDTADIDCLTVDSCLHNIPIMENFQQTNVHLYNFCYLEFD